MIVLWILPKIPLSGQTQISGFVKDKQTHEVLIGANVYSPDFHTGTITDNDGYFNLVLKDKTDVINFSYVGYETYSLSLGNIKDTVLTIYLNPSVKLEEVEIMGSREKGINTASLSREELLSIPSIGAEPDIMKSLQFLPGVLSQNEGSSNLLIRGGGPGENLFLLDNVPLFYVNHLGGFVSVFNPDIINDVTVYKGGFPAKYGGKLSSVIDITLREGDKKNFKGSADIGLLGAGVTLEGPIRENSSYIFTGRKTLTELLMWAGGLIANQQYIVSYGFYDLNGKISWNRDQKNQFQFSAYTGDDHLKAFMYTNKEQDFSFTNRWGNLLVAGNWKHVYSPKIFSKSSISLTRYRLRNRLKTEISRPDSGRIEHKRIDLSSVRDISFKSDWRYRPFNGYAMDFGIQSSYLYFTPNKSWETREEQKQDASSVYALESSVYLENHINIQSYVKLNLGIRGVNYYTPGYTESKLEPRVELILNPLRNQSLHFSYMNVNQYGHMLYSPGTILNNEIWVPALREIPSSASVQITGGWKGSFLNNMYKIELNAYMKKMENLITLKDGYLNILGDINWISKVEPGGKGESKGIEFFIRKNKGNWSGFLSYAFSQTTRQFDNINSGKPFVFAYDRPHSLSLDIHRKINDCFTINLAWIFQTGLPYTPAIGRMRVPYTNSLYTYYDYTALIYGERNSARMKNYHRLDVALYYNTETRLGRDATWTFSVYNLYNRRNPYFYYYNTKPELNFTLYHRDDPNALKQYQFTFFPIIPSVSYKIAF